MYFADEQEIEAVRRVFQRKKLFRYQLNGPGECEIFEREFAAAIGTPHALLVTSGTNALIAALSASGVGAGDEVIIPSYTFVATAAAVLNVGAKPVIADIDETLGVSPLDIERRLSSRTKAIIPVHMDGLASDMDLIDAIARRHGLRLIEDVAQAVGGSFRKRALGAIGDFGCFSLNENKNISAGEGGIVTTKTRDDFERCFCMQDASAQFNPANKGFFTCIEPFLGGSMRVSEITGAIMRVQLRRLENILGMLRERKAVFLAHLGESRDVKAVLGNCAEGDCGSSLHLLFSSAELAAKAGEELRTAGLLFAPVTLRPAHASWKWRLPGYSAAQNLPSLDILSRTLKYDIRPEDSIEETERKGILVGKTLQGILCDWRSS